METKVANEDVKSTTGMTFHFHEAALRLKEVVNRTPLQFNHNLSRKYKCNIYLKREDLQVVRSYKLRGAYNMMSSLPKEQLEKGVVCASAGNHAQGVAYHATRLGMQATIVMPVPSNCRSGNVNASAISAESTKNTCR